MKYPPITAELLKSKMTCTSQLDLFQKHFKDKPAPLNKKVFTKLASHFDINWAAGHLLDSTDYIEYYKLTNPAFAEYDKVTSHALAKYVKVTKVSTAKYQKVTRTALRKLNKVRALVFLTLYTA